MLLLLHTKGDDWDAGEETCSGAADVGARVARGGSFLGREGPQKSTPYPGFKLEFKKTHLKSKNST